MSKHPFDPFQPFVKYEYIYILYSEHPFDPFQPFVKYEYIYVETPF